MKQTLQEKTWSGKFGKEYTDRNIMNEEELDIFYKNLFNISNTELINEFLKGLKQNKILEVGCNVGNQLLLLKKLGYIDLWGIELQEYAVEIAKKRINNVSIIKASAFDIPYKDKFFDLVFTSGMLIHISPNDINDAIDEIYRCTNKYIWGLESYSKEGYNQITYRDRPELYWKTDFAKLFLNRYHNLKIIKARLLQYVGSSNIDIMYLLEKKNKNRT